MQPSQSELEFYQDRCPALIDSGWEWSDHRSFLSSMAIRKLEDISYRGLKDEKLVCVSVHYHNDGTRSRFWVQIRNMEYPSFVYDDWVSVDAYKATSQELFDAATNAASSLLKSKLEEILEAEEKEEKRFLEIEQIKLEQRKIKWKLKLNQMAKKFLFLARIRTVLKEFLRVL
jgi:hypothetical protein